MNHTRYLCEPSWSIMSVSLYCAAPSPQRRAKVYARKIIDRFFYSVKGCFARVETSPIIVLGNQKSGTSAIAHLLAGLGGLSKTIDIPPLWPPVGVQIMRGQVEFASVVRKHKAYFSTKLIKEPMMTFFADQVVEFFPKGKIVFVIRDPRDNIRSLLNRRGIPGYLEEIEEQYLPVSPPHSTVVDARVWGGEGENYIGVLAHRWNRAADSYFQYADQAVLIRYEDFVRDKEGLIRDIARRLGIPWKHRISDRVDFQYQPPGDHRISREKFFGSDNLERIESICRIRMARLGYTARTIKN